MIMKLGFVFTASFNALLSQRLVYGRRTDPFLLTMDQENKLELHRNVKMSQAFERVARYMFPICFGFFNIVYWSFYVERSYYP
ncbi:hypothetical protein HPB49_000568 [Dermacentor silvarum]|uniref:Uncharacterized protein n=1 Tax=Dermacentor silvarum TaxID=543639 RepID=A0ACB8CIV1_DERSI|nr:hypothetical protein HPB49_000568 [Dermacentor silvarum]